MALRARPTVQITLSDNERDTLQRWSRRHPPAQAQAFCSRVVLASAKRRIARVVASELRSTPSGPKWRHRLAEGRLERLTGHYSARRGAHHRRRRHRDSPWWKPWTPLPTTPTGPPGGLAKKHGTSHETVTQIWKAQWAPILAGRTASKCPPTPTWSRGSETWSGCTCGRSQTRRLGPLIDLSWAFRRTATVPQRREFHREASSPASSIAATGTVRAPSRRCRLLLPTSMSYQSS